MKAFFALALWLVIFSAHAQGAALKAALILEHDQPSPWTEMLKTGFQKAVAKGGGQADIIIAPKTLDQTAIFRDAAQSHDLVIVSSDAMHEILRDNAANYRRVMFGSIDAGIRAPNIMSVTFADEQASYLAGAAAAMLAAEMPGGEPVIGWLSGEDTPAMRSLFNGYSEGAIFAQPGCRVIQAVAGSFTSPGQAAKKAQWLMDAGARIIALAAGAGNSGAKEAAAAANIPVIELDGPSGGLPVGVIAKAADRAVAEIVASAQSGKFAGKEILIYDLANNGVDFTGLDAFLKKHAASEKPGRRVKELRRELAAGSIRVPSLRQRTLCDCLD